MQTKKDASIATLVNSAITDGQLLVKQQIELAKAELAHSAKHAASTSGMLIGAGVLAFLAFVFMLVAGAYGLVAAGLPVWAGFLIVAGILLLVAAILGLLGRNQARKVGPPQRAINQAQQTKAQLASRGAASPGTAVALPTESAVTPTP